VKDEIHIENDIENQSDRHEISNIKQKEKTQIQLQSMALKDENNKNNEKIIENKDVMVLDENRINVGKPKVDEIVEIPLNI